MAFLTYAYLLTVLFVANSMQSEYQPCKNGQPKPTNLVITGCNKLPCPLKRGSDVEAQISFTAPQSTKTLKPVVDVELGKIHINYKLPQQNACKDLLHAKCPLDKGDQATYKLKMPVEKSYPLVSMVIQISLVDDHSKSQVCIRIPATVVN